MSPWIWKPSLSAWLRQVDELAAAWRPKELDSDQVKVVRDVVQRACFERAAWLYHPFCAAITAEGDAEYRPRDIQAIAWIAANCPGLDLRVTVADPARLVSSRGEEFVLEGTYSAGELALLMMANSSSLDRDSLAAPPILARSDYMAIRADYFPGPEQIDAFEQGTGRIFRAMPNVGNWIAGTVRMAAPLPPPADGSFASSSSPHVPGLIRLSLGNDILELLETIVHETAHLYLYRFEQAGRLVKENCETAFTSPLRSDPRPLRGILLAMHACAYIAAAFAEAGAAALDDPRKCKAQKLEVLDLFDQASQVVDTATGFLTAKGMAFTERTRSVATLASSQ
jgi:hypothetical protein